MNDQKRNEERNAGTEAEEELLDAHRQMVLWLFIATACVGVALLALMLWFDRSDHDQLGENGFKPTIMFVVVIAGALGGFVSCLRRLYAFQDIFPRRQYARLFRRINFYLVAYSTIPALIGMIAAAVVYVIFAAGLLKGGLFPEFHCGLVEGKCDELKKFVSHWKPVDAVDFAKAIVWGFIAGFSEKFFVDILNQFSVKIQSDTKLPRG